MKSHEKVQREYREWKEQTLQRLEELRAQPDTALAAAANACGDERRQDFVEALFAAVDKNSFRGQFSEDIELSEETMLGWLAAVRDDKVWTGSVPYAKKDHPKTTTTPWTRCMA